ncbi:unnamed protein product [Phyllotreta striolata]|uniref:CCHC-type domain-containing protein n=1 Tax=Phyllotreta striolata TaxID=444603 RepID=A0A9N9TQL3_PHYSR|nr:unnamed protein product [Phyllotreta striolata]
MASDSGGPSGPLGRPPDIPKRKGSNRIGIEFITSKYANEFLDNDKLKEESKWESYIPASLVTSRGIIRDIDLSTSMEEIKNFGKASTKILDARRLNRRIANQQTVEYVPSETVLITFEGKNIPNTVSINYYESRVKVYVGPVLQCFNCLRYGHSSKQCRSHIRCSRCGEEHEATNCQKDIKCIFCKLEHLATDRKQCTEFERQKQIKEIMCYENLSYYEASKRVPRPGNQRTNYTITRAEEFPELGTTKKMPQSTKNNFITVNERRQNTGTNNRTTYSQVIKTPQRKRQASSPPILNYNKEAHIECLFPPPCRTSTTPILNTNAYQRNLSNEKDTTEAIQITTFLKKILRHTTLTTEQIDKVIDETQSIEFEKIYDKTNENMATSPIPSEDGSKF